MATKKSTSRPSGIVVTDASSMTCRTCTHCLDVTLWGCWMAIGCRAGLDICANCQQHKGKTV